MVKLLRGRYSIFAFTILWVIGLVACADQTGLSEEAIVSPTVAPTAPLTGRGVGDTLHVMFYEAPTILNPHLSLAYKDWEPCRVTYEPLASFDADGNLIPFLAAAIPSLDNGGVASDGKSVTWKLKQGVQWSDGEPFTAADVLFTYEFITNPAVASPSSSSYGNVERVEVIDDYTVRVHFKEATPAWSVPFIGIPGMILPKHMFEAYNGANAQEAPANQVPVGTGPYRVMPPGIKPQEVIFLGSQLVETNKIVYEPNPFFREEDKPFFRRVEWRGGITASEAARSVLKDGDVDYAVDLSSIATDELLTLEEGGKGRLVTVLGPGVERILLNRTDPNRQTATGERSSLEFPHPFFSDKRVRQAFAHAINQEAIAALYGVTGLATENNLVSPAQYNSPNSFYAFDLERAAALLDEAGWIDTNNDGFRDKDGIKMKVVYQAYQADIVQETQRIIRRDLESIGVEVEPKIIDSSIMFSDDPGSHPDTLWRFNADMQQFTHNTYSPDPTAYMRDWTCSQIPQQSNNWTGYNVERWCNEEYDALYEKVLTVLDPEERRDIFIQMNDLLIEDVVMIPLVHKSWISGANREIEGINLTPWDNELWNVKDWRYQLP